MCSQFLYSWKQSLSTSFLKQLKHFGGLKDGEFLAILLSVFSHVSHLVGQHAALANLSRYRHTVFTGNAEEGPDWPIFGIVFSSDSRICSINKNVLFSSINWLVISVLIVRLWVTKQAKAKIATQPMHRSLRCLNVVCLQDSKAKLQYSSHHTSPHCLRIWTPRGRTVSLVCLIAVMILLALCGTHNKHSQFTHTVIQHTVYAIKKGLERDQLFPLQCSRTCSYPGCSKAVWMQGNQKLVDRVGVTLKRHRLDPTANCT